MPQRSRSTGVGRGNGVGSAKTQFKNGMPSANPHGRPKREKLTTPGSLVASLARELGELIDVTIDGKRQRMPMHQMMVKDLLRTYPTATPAIKMRILKICVEFMPEVEELRHNGPSEEAISDFCSRIMEGLQKEPVV